MIMTILDGLMPVAVVVLVGWLSGKLQVLKHEDASVIATYVIRFALPVSLFVGALGTAPKDLLNYGLLGTTTVGLLGTFLATLVVGRLFLRHDLRTASVQGLVCAFPDMAYFAAPVLAALFGAIGFLPILLGNLVTMIVLFPLTIILMQLGQRDAASGSMVSVLLGSVKSAFLNPIVWLPLLGVILSLMRIKLPHPLFLSVDLIGRSAGGTSLFALGLLLYGEPVRINANVLANIGLKNFLQPALMLVGALIFALPASVREQAILMGSAPSATAASIFALKSKVYTSDATSTVLVSTILSIFTAAALIALIH